MDYQKFINSLPALYTNWGREAVHPKTSKFQQVLDQIQGMTTANIMQLLNWAVDCMEPNEIYCEIGTYQGSTLVGALLDHPNRMAYAVDNFSEFDDGTSLGKLLDNLETFHLTPQVCFCDQDFQDFLLDLRNIETENQIGVYFYDGAHDYRSTLLGLLLAKPFLSDRALIILDDANWETVQQATWDFLSISPEAQLVLDLPTPAARFSSFWNGIQILSWDRAQNCNYETTVFSEKRHKSVVQAIYKVQLLEQREDELQTVHNEAKYWHQNHQLGTAEQRYREYLLWREQDPEAWLNLGVLYYEAKNYQQSFQAFRTALDLDPENGRLYYLLGCTLEQMQRSDLAISAYETAIELDSTQINAYNNLGNLLQQQDKIAAAKSIYERAISLEPGFFGTYINLGNLLAEQGQLELAIEAFQMALRLNTDDADTAHNLSVISEAKNNPAPYLLQNADNCLQQKKAKTAVKLYQQYLEIQSGDAETYLNLSNLLWRDAQVEAAINILRSGVQLYPESEQLAYELIIKLMQSNQTQAAISNAKQAISQFSNSYTFKLLHSLMLPYVYNTPEEIECYYQRFIEGLQALIIDTSLNTPEARESALLGIGRFSSFYLTYQSRNMLEPQLLYGSLVQTIMAANYPQWVQPITMPDVNGKIRIGYVSHYLHSYSGTFWLTGWLRHHNHTDFEIYCYYTGDAPDHITEQFRQYSDVFHHFPNDLVSSCQQILVDQLHLLVFPEIGMDPKTVQMAALRLAPIQATAWGHPVTTGLSTIDYYLSSELMEPDNAQSHYSETLVYLPNLGIAYPKPNLPALTKTRTDFRLEEDAIIYLCCQAPFKYLPQHDYLLIEIARQVPQSRFVFLRAETLQPRLQQSFASVGLNVDTYCVFLPALVRNDYLMLNLLSDIYLDTIGFTGGNTTMDAIACGLPIVTYSGELMRGRLSYGILQLAQVTETIAKTEKEYIDIAVNLGLDADWRASVVQSVIDSSDRVFDDKTSIEALEAFYREAVQNF